MLTVGCWQRAPLPGWPRRWWSTSRTGPTGRPYRSESAVAPPPATLSPNAARHNIGARVETHLTCDRSAYFFRSSWATRSSPRRRRSRTSFAVAGEIPAALAISRKESSGRALISCCALQTAVRRVEWPDPAVAAKPRPPVGVCRASSASDSGHRACGQASRLANPTRISVPSVTSGATRWTNWPGRQAVSSARSMPPRNKSAASLALSRGAAGHVRPRLTNRLS
jgi:hypothetical protein